MKNSRSLFILFFVSLPHSLSCRFAASTKKKAPGKAGLRYYKNVGLGFKTPREAIEGTFAPRTSAKAGDSC